MQRKATEAIVRICIARTAERFDVPPPIVFGHVLVHEIGHLLLGSRHSASGVMRAHFDRRAAEMRCAAG